MWKSKIVSFLFIFFYMEMHAHVYVYFNWVFELEFLPYFAKGLRT